MRSIFAKAGGQLAGSGAVAWQFEPRGLITVPREGADPDEVALAAIDAGAADVDTEVDPIEIYTEPGDLESVRKALEAAGVAVDVAPSRRCSPSRRSSSTRDQARQALRLVELLEDLDDVQRVTANFDIPEELLAEVAG